MSQAHSLHFSIINKSSKKTQIPNFNLFESIQLQQSQTMAKQNDILEAILRNEKVNTKNDFNLDKNPTGKIFS